MNIRRKFLLDLIVGFAAYLEVISLTLHISQQYSFNALPLLLPLWTLVWVVIYSHHFANSARRCWEKTNQALLIAR